MTHSKAKLKRAVAIKHSLVLDPKNAIDSFVYYITEYTLSNRNGVNKTCISVDTMSSKVVSRNDSNLSLKIKLCFRKSHIQLSENLLSHKPQTSEIHMPSLVNLN
jgi:hypothetical protein